MRKKYLIIVVSLGILLMTSCTPEKTRATKGHLELNSVPPGADVTVNSRIKIKKRTPVNVRLRPGSYLIKMTKENRQPAWRYVKIAAGGKTSLTLSLPPVRGAVLIVSRPAGGKVVMRGKNLGVTPLVLTGLKPGEYSAQIELLNRSSRSVKWEITSARPQKVTVSLESNVGKLVLKTQPERARVYIDDKANGFTPYSGDIQEGRHNVKITLDGFADVKTTLEVIRDRKTTKTIAMVRLPGSFKFLSSPEGAQIYINGKSFGKTPLTVAGLQAGQYKIRIQKNGFDGISRDAYIRAGRTNTVEFVLLRNTGGIDLIVNPPGVSVYVNGKKHGMTVQGESKDLSKVIHIRNLPAGKYRIMLAHKRMMPPTKSFWVTVRKARISRPEPINVWIANAVLKIKDEPQIIVLLYEENKKNIIYSPEPGVKIRKSRSKIDFVRPLTEEDL